jgi:YfiH family protein
MNPEEDFIYPEWPAPENVKAAVSTRSGGCSVGLYESANMAMHVDDKTADVIENRGALRKALQLPHEPCWLNQVHGGTVVESSAMPGQEGDGSFTQQVGQPCVVQSADCLPILMCNKEGTWVAALHAGWKSLAARIVENGVTTYPGNADELIAWLGPAIGPEHFEVHQDVLDAVTQDLSGMQKKVIQKKCFTEHPEKANAFLCDIFELARQRLGKAGVNEVFGGGMCNFEDERFYSFRRDGKKTGRFASVVWMQ